MNKLYNESDIQATAQAIRDRANIDDMLKVEDFAEKIESIPYPEGTYTITENGSYNIEDYEEVSVNVPQEGGSGTIVSKTITANGTYNAEDDDADGYDPVVVNVQPTLDQIDITENGTYYPDEGTDGFDEVHVSISPNLLSQEFDTNGVYTAPYPYDGYNVVTVDVEPHLQSKTATENGTVTADAGYDGLSSVVVNVSGGGSEIKSGSFMLESDITCTADNPYTITHNLGKAPKYFLMWYGNQPYSSTASGINQVDYAVDTETGINYHTVSRNQSSSTRAYIFTVGTDIEINTNTVVIKNWVMMGKGAFNNPYRWLCW